MGLWELQAWVLSRQSCTGLPRQYSWLLFQEVHALGVISMSTVEAVTMYPFGHRPTLMYNLNIVEFFDELCMQTLYTMNFPFGEDHGCAVGCAGMYCVHSWRKFIVLYDDHHYDCLESLLSMCSYYHCYRLEHSDMESMGMQWTHKNMNANAHKPIAPTMHTHADRRFKVCVCIHSIFNANQRTGDVIPTGNKQQVIFCS